MNLLIDIGHPSDLHLYKHFAREMQSRGHNVLFTCRDKDHLAAMLDDEGLPFECFGPNYKSITGKIVGLPRFTRMVWRVARRFNPDVFISSGSMYAAPVARWLKKPHIAFEDTFNREQVMLYKPFTQCILTGDYTHPMKSEKVLRYTGYHELAYLHPNRFVPDQSVRSEMGVADKEKYVIIRFVSWTASHDVGHKGMSAEIKLKAVRAFSRHARVFVSSEGPLSPELEGYRFPCRRNRMHDAMAFASLVFGESASMAAEAAVLGVPAICVHNTGTYYTRNLEQQYGLVSHFGESEKDQQAAINKGVELLALPGGKQAWQEKREHLLADTIDVTAFMVWFIENYPESKITLQVNPEKALIL